MEKWIGLKDGHQTAEYDNRGIAEIALESRQVDSISPANWAKRQVAK